MTDTSFYYPQEEQTGLMPVIRRNPLTSAAVAFGVAAAIAGIVSSRVRSRTPKGRMDRVKKGVGRLVEQAAAVTGPKVRQLASPALGSAFVRKIAVSVAMPIGAAILRNAVQNTFSKVSSRRRR